MLSQEEIEWVDDYLRGNLTESELVDFHNRLSNDKYFKKEVDHLKSISDNFERIAIKESLVELESKINNNKGFVNFRFMSVAAGLALLIVLPFVLTYFNKNTNASLQVHGSKIEHKKLIDDSLKIDNDSISNNF